MRFLLWLVGLLAVLYGGYWFVGQRAVERGAVAALTQMQADGWDVTYDDISTRGFPSRFDTTVTAPHLLDPVTGTGWEAPWLQILALSYMPNEVIALFPDSQTVILPRDRIDVAAADMRASARLGFSAALPLDNVTIESGPVALTGETGWQAGLARMLLALRHAGGSGADYDIWFEGTDITLPEAGQNAALPRALPVLRLDGTFTLDQPIDRHMQPGARMVSLALRQALVDFGATGLRADGALTFDPAGIPQGSINLTIRDWRAALAIAVAAGAVPQGMAGLAERAGTLLAAGGTDLSAPLVFDAGQMRLGPVPLGPAPALFAPAEGW